MILSVYAETVGADIIARPLNGNIFWLLMSPASVVVKVYDRLASFLCRFALPSTI